MSARLEAAAQAVKLAFSQCPSYDVLVPALLEHGPLVRTLHHGPLSHFRNVSGNRANSMIAERQNSNFASNYVCLMCFRTADATEFRRKLSLPWGGPASSSGFGWNDSLHSYTLHLLYSIVSPTMVFQLQNGWRHAGCGQISPLPARCSCQANAGKAHDGSVRGAGQIFGQAVHLRIQVRRREGASPRVTWCLTSSSLNACVNQGKHTLCFPCFDHLNCSLYGCCVS